MNTDYATCGDYDEITEYRTEWYGQLASHKLFVGLYRSAEATYIEPRKVYVVLMFNDGRIFNEGYIQQWEKVDDILRQWVVNAEQYATLYPEPVTITEVSRRLNHLLGEDN